MAALMMTDSSGGSSSIEDLSGGEAFLIWWLKTNYCMSAQGYDVEHVTNGISCGDMGNISKVKFQLTVRCSGNIYGDFYLFGANYSYRAIADTDYSYNGVTNTKIIERTPNGDNCGISTTSGSQYCIGEIRVLSFTTKDGKVHTADNLNY